MHAHGECVINQNTSDQLTAAQNREMLNGIHYFQKANQYKYKH